MTLLGEHEHLPSSDFARMARAAGMMTGHLTDIILVNSILSSETSRICFKNLPIVVETLRAILLRASRRLS
jgi:hypothetical protein